MIDFPDGTLIREQDLCRKKLEQAKLRYAENRSQENRTEFLRALKAFADMAMQGKVPGD